MFDATGILLATTGITIDGLGITVVLSGIFFVLTPTIGNTLKIEPTLKLHIERFRESCNYDLKPRHVIHKSCSKNCTSNLKG